MSKVKFFICPMSKNIVDSVIEINSEKLGLLPSRRQIDYDGGYVNEWNTKSFTDYVKTKSNIIILYFFQMVLLAIVLLSLMIQVKY